MTYFLIVHKKSQKVFDCYYRENELEAKAFYAQLKTLYRKGDIVMFRNQPMADIRG